MISRAIVRSFCVLGVVRNSARGLTAGGILLTASRPSISVIDDFV